MSNDNVLKVLNELTDILDLSDEFTYRELYEQARTYIFNKRMEVQDITIVTGIDPMTDGNTERPTLMQARTLTRLLLKEKNK